MLGQSTFEAYIVTQDRRESLGRWIANSLNLRDIISLVILLTTLAGGYFTLQTRITILETRQAEWQSRYEKEVVPREVLEERSKNILEKLDAIERKLPNKTETLYQAPNFTYVPGYKVRKH
jgi:Tfp pilus assembly protein PilO